MNYAGHIFDTFARLDGSKIYEGNGIRLATFKRICQRFAGDVSIQDCPGKGCEVQVILPEALIIKRDSEESDSRDIKIGVIGDLSGIACKEELGKYYAYQLATDEINACGGIDGKPVRMFFRDDRSRDELTKKAVGELTEQEYVHVLMGSALSPSRDIIRHQVYRTKTLYIDTQ